MPKPLPQSAKTISKQDSPLGQLAS
ncbi:hypothetical protein NC651_016473 [Populus alba x Populus x berolinensis]|uniref:Uncharacterized protein n=1 Tax=Populus alba x Populus x berolinensis TaxID=444605 RepID=A0AAD6QP28_9ROSI|nr:hypothetical protein NC651_016473 [Populus alba x Populus x berolinensis]KAJ6993957.1 hypothetical protein NC653_016938 [Populus alba x Populus x berolinensis]